MLTTGCNKYDNYFIDSLGILYKQVIDFNIIFSAIVVLQSLIKYLLHASHDLVGHVGVIKLYHFLKQLLLLSRHEKKIASICEILSQMSNHELIRPKLY